GGEAIANDMAVGTGQSAQVIVDAAMEAFGRIDILVNNAGGSAAFCDVDGDSDDRVEAVIRTNLLGSAMLMRRVWPIMREQRYGRVVNTSSNSVLGMGGALAYASAKGGIIGLSSTAAIEGEALGILVNVVFPAAYTRGVELRDSGTMEWFRAF